MIALVDGCAAEVRRTPVELEELLSMRDAADAQFESQIDVAMGVALARIKAEYDEHTTHQTSAPPVADILIISGGGDWGAFGAGVLKGWGKVQSDAMARPSFDIVTGVSTGALIAPFAFLGDEPAIDKVVSFYRNPRKDWLRSRGLLSLLRGGASYADVPGLERDLRSALDAESVRRIVDAGQTGRMLVVNTTNIDTGAARAWDLCHEAEVAVSTGKKARLEQILLASAAIPGVFPPREIDGMLYVDGAVTGNILIGSPRTRKDEDTFVARWKSTYPGVPVPTIRYWVIFNNKIRAMPETVQPKWSRVLVKSSSTATRAATVNSMRQLFLQAQLAQCRHDANVEVRIIAVPEEWEAPKPGVFVRETMVALEDLGERMGADPTSWRTNPP